MQPTDITLTLDRTIDENWATAALEQWTQAAEKAGLTVTVISYEVADVNRDAGIVEANGVRYLITVQNDEIGAKADAKTVEILVSDSSEGGEGARPSWMIVDDTDCLLTGIEWHDGETIEGAIARFVEVGTLPADAQVERVERMRNPYPWQPSGYQFRWTVSA